MDPLRVEKFFFYIVCLSVSCSSRDIGSSDREEGNRENRAERSCSDTRRNAQPLSMCRNFPGDKGRGTEEITSEKRFRYVS